MSVPYDEIGVGYATRRRSDPRIEAAIHAHLGSVQSLVNVGAGTGSYEPNWAKVTAIEPSAEMIRQRPPGSAPVVQASAEDLPFPDDTFDAAMAILTVHHWSEIPKGLAEMRRVARDRIVILTFDPDNTSFWLSEYLPELVTLDQRQMPGLEVFAEVFGPVRRYPVPIPRDCVDGFLCAYWQQPEKYLDPAVRRSISSFAKIGDCSEGLARLEADIASGVWHRKFGHLLELDFFDFGYYLVVTE